MVGVNGIVAMRGGVGCDFGDWSSWEQRGQGSM